MDKSGCLRYRKPPKAATVGQEGALQNGSWIERIPRYRLLRYIYFAELGLGPVYPFGWGEGSEMAAKTLSR